MIAVRRYVNATSHPLLLPKFSRSLCLVLIHFLAVTICFGQQEAYVSPAGTKFFLYTPPGYLSSTNTFPLLLSLHSKGEVGDDLSELTSNNPEQMPCRLIYLNKWPQDLPFIVLTPQLRPEAGIPDAVWGPQWPAEYIDEVVRYVTANFRVDTQRIYVTGISKGGIGTWMYASAFPEKVAAMIPISGRSDLTWACAVKNIPTWVFHGDGDQTVIPKYSIDMVNAIKACQPPGTYKPRLNILNVRNHNAWNEVYNGTSGYKIYEWLLTFRKNDLTNKKPYVNAGPDLRIKLRNERFYIAGDFFDSDGTVASVTWKQTAGSPLTLSETTSNLLALSGLRTGTFQFQLSVTDDDGAQSTDTIVLEITDGSTGPAVSQLVLVNGKTDAEIGNLSEGQVINKTALNLTEINIKAIAGDGTGSVKFSVNTDQNIRTINAAPYLIKGQTTSPEWVIANGTYLICATPYPQTSARGNPGISQCYRITFTETAPSQTCENSGQIRQELWTGISGTLVSSIPVDKNPSSLTDLTLFEGPSNIGDHYGRRIRGYLCPPETGNYTFWISSNDNSELWLSTDSNPANRKKIASVTGYTNVRQWDKYTSQKSVTVNLMANHKYYVEALHKEGTGTDHVAVGWQLPSATFERPIPGVRLIPYNTTSAAVPVVSITSPAAGQTFTDPANINISANASESGGTIAKVEFYNGTAKLGEDLTAPWSFAWNNVPSGSYTVKAKAVDNAGASATASVNISVGTGASCAATGTILREMWTGIQGNAVVSIPVNEMPDAVSELIIFEDPSNVADNYGTRLRGYLCVPLSGAYTFWIASNDNSELWLSTDANPLNAKRIAWVTGYTAAREWTKYASQKSAAVNLVAGQTYYLHALHKEGIGSDHMAVGWQLPNGTLERPIPGSRLSPFRSASASTLSSGAISLYPNPAPAGSTQLQIQERRDGSGYSLKQVEVFGSKGEVIFIQIIPDNTTTIDSVRIIRLQHDLKPGLYIVHLVTTGSRTSTRLLVK
jgi:hypothetical protein